MSWASLPVAEQEEMDEVVAMLTEAAAQGHLDAQEVLADIYNFGEGVVMDKERALELYRQAALQGSADAHFNVGYLLDILRQDFDGAEAAYHVAIAANPGYATAHYNLGNLLLQKERKDFDGAEAAYRAAIAADPGHAGAHNNLGILLKKERKDIDGAEAAYRAAIAADPGYANAHSNLGILLEERAQEIVVKSGGDLAVVAALYDECAQLWGVSKGLDHEWTKEARAKSRLIGRAHGRMESATLTGSMCL